ncbi:MAG: antibiotic ABC transporter ATP-binding protein [Crocinitomix sp. MedPE-SWsnd]|nr:MAG: antibiotic ABC transporter ATP-binding protein [Crocinitomix sp. MedPE-SWsnd]
MEEKKSKFDFTAFKRLLAYMGKYKRISLASLLAVVTIAMVSVFQPYLIGSAISRLVIEDQSGDFFQWNWMIEIFGNSDTRQGQFLSWTIILIILLVAEGILTFFTTYLGALLGQSIIRDMRVKLFRHLNSFKMKYFDRTPNGVVVTRVVSDIEAVSEFFSSGFINFIGESIKIIAILIVMCIVDWRLALLSLIPIPLLLFATRIFAKAMKRYFQKERLQVTKLNTFVQEHISGMSIVQLFSRTNREYNTFQGINEKHKQAHIGGIWAISTFFPIVELLSSLSIAAVIFWTTLQIGVLTDENAASIGVVFMFVLWIYKLYRPIRQMADRFNVIQRGMVRAERVFEILDREEHIDASGHVQNVDFNQDISFKDVWFAYNDEDWVLKGVDFEVPAGKSVALVGATGAGKSTIINLITRFYEYQKGDLKIGDTSVRDIELNELRKSVAVVLQDVFLFSDTIINNITLGDESITQEEVEKAAKMVGAHEFIMNLPDGYDYNVRERGGVLSVGQKQLISFIRAYVYNPKILILDEATASVDSESEEMIQKATQELQKGRTSIVIAHRLSTIVNSDEILVIDDGRILERGTHQELLDQNGQYKKLYELNFS